MTLVINLRASLHKCEIIFTRLSLPVLHDYAEHSRVPGRQEHCLRTRVDCMGMGTGEHGTEIPDSATSCNFVFYVPGEW
jgi:hypothetical protein